MTALLSSAVVLVLSTSTYENIEKKNKNFYI